MSTTKELQHLLDKAKKANRELRKENRELKKESKEKDLHIQFLTERLSVWADRNFEERQARLNMTIDDVMAFALQKPDNSKERELAEKLSQQNLNNEKLKQGVSGDNTS
jgi:hypothetical protein